MSEGFVKVSNDFCRSDLDPYSKAILLFIASHKEEMALSNNLISETLRISVSTVKRKIKYLIDTGVLHQKYKGNGMTHNSSRYALKDKNNLLDYDASKQEGVSENPSWGLKEPGVVLSEPNYSSLRTQLGVTENPSWVHKELLNKNIYKNNIRTRKNSDSSVYVNKIYSIIDYLNKKINSKFHPLQRPALEFMTELLKEGYTESDFQKVIDTKVQDWLHRPDMVASLRPKTLFHPEKFSDYLNQPTATDKAQTDAELEAFIKYSKKRREMENGAR